jgi:hypothetical protein
VAGLAGLAGTVLPGPKGQGAAWVAKTEDALTYEPRTALGKGVTKAVSYPFEKLSDLADYAGGKVSDKAGPAAGAAANTTLQALPLLLGRVAPMGEAAKALERRTTLKEANRQVDAGTVKAKEAGYVLPPSQANPSIFNQFMEGVSGKIKTAQKASIQNQDVTNSLVRKGLGIKDDAPLTVETLSEVRKQAGQDYERVRGAGRVTADEAYSKTLDSIAEPYRRAAKDFPEAAETQVLKAIESARVPAFDAGSAVDQIRIFRDKADKAYRAGDKGEGGAYKGIAKALEDQLDRHIEQSGADPKAVADFRKAREVIAKTYTVEKYLGKDGNVDARGLARELKKKPLSGEIRTAAAFAEQFPKAAQMPEKVGGVPMSLFDLAIGGGAGAMMHNPAYVAAAAARPAVRSLVLSKPYQNTFVNPPNYGQSPLSRLAGMAGRLQGQPLVPLSEIAQGQRQ